MASWGYFNDLCYYEIYFARFTNENIGQLFRTAKCVNETKEKESQTQMLQKAT